jgi:hypothetical protein
MAEPLPILMENAIQIAWDYLERTGELGEPEVASRILLDTVELIGPSRRAAPAISIEQSHRCLQTIQK